MVPDGLASLRPTLESAQAKVPTQGTAVKKADSGRLLGRSGLPGSAKEVGAEAPARYKLSIRALPKLRRSA
jgi:hypothetical protein